MTTQEEKSSLGTLAFYLSVSFLLLFIIILGIKNIKSAGFPKASNVFDEKSAKRLCLKKAPRNTSFLDEIDDEIKSGRIDLFEGVCGKTSVRIFQNSGGTALGKTLDGDTYYLYIGTIDSPLLDEDEWYDLIVRYTGQKTYTTVQDAPRTVRSFRVVWGERL